MEMLAVAGSIEFMGEEYEYTARCEKRGNDWYPERITELDRSDDEPVDDGDFEKIEAAALEHAWTLV